MSKKCLYGHHMVIMGNGVRTILQADTEKKILVKEYWCRRCKKTYWRKRY